MYTLKENRYKTMYMPVAGIEHKQQMSNPHCHLPTHDTYVYYEADITYTYTHNYIIDYNRETSVISTCTNNVDFNQGIIYTLGQQTPGYVRSFS
jgi:hypothetical protein